MGRTGWDDDEGEGKEPHEIKDVLIKHVTADALLARLPSGKEVWFPKSQVHDNSAIWKAGETGTLTVTVWIAEKKGLL